MPVLGHAAVVVADFEATFAALERAGHAPERHRELWGEPRGFVTMPGGHRVEFMAAPPEPAVWRAMRIGRVVHGELAKVQGRALTRTGARSRTIAAMRLELRSGKNGRRARRAASLTAEALSVAAQMALLWPANMDIWVQRKMAGSSREKRPRC